MTYCPVYQIEHEGENLSVIAVLLLLSCFIHGSSLTAALPDTLPNTLLDKSCWLARKGKVYVRPEMPLCRLAAAVRHAVRQNV